MSFSYHNSNRFHRHGFTLVELIMAAAIIAVLASLAVGVLRGAQDDAREAATISRISQIRVLLLDRMEEFEVRQVPLDLTNSLYGISNATWRRAIGQRILADMLYSEMPTGPRVDLGQFPSNALQTWLNQRETDGDMADATQLINDLSQPAIVPVMIQRVTYFSAGNPLYDLSSEYLYQILLSTDRDGESGIELITNRGVGDTDTDNVFEVVDAWNNSLGIVFSYVDDNFPNGIPLSAALVDENIVYLEMNKIRIDLISQNL